MRDKLNWGYSNHDFSAIHETISKYYPIEDPHKYYEKKIGDFKGVNKIEKILHDNFFNTKNYRERWGKFKKFLKQELKMPIHESMVAFYPCYSGILKLKKEKSKNGNTYSKELHFFISLLGPYYTILGIDKSEINLEEIFPRLKGGEELRSRSFAANLAITVSPYLEYKDSFLLLQEKILKYFPSLKFIPYDISIKKAKNIAFLNPDSEAEDFVFSALFRPDNFFNAETRGDTYFGFDEWLIVKKPDKKNNKIKEDLLKKSLKVGSRLTVHKVWKFKAANIIPINSNIGMFGLDLFEVLDLTDINFATIIFKEDEEPVISNYAIVDKEIKIERFQNKLKFRIPELQENELKIIVKIDLIVNEQKTIKGDILEMIFEVYK